MRQVAVLVTLLLNLCMLVLFSGQFFRNLSLGELLLFLLVSCVYFVRGVAQNPRECHTPTGRCYWLGTGRANWPDARTACQSEGGDLAVIETLELWDFVDAFFALYGQILFLFLLLERNKDDCFVSPFFSLFAGTSPGLG